MLNIYILNLLFSLFWHYHTDEHKSCTSPQWTFFYLANKESFDQLLEVKLANIERFIEGRINSLCGSFVGHSCPIHRLQFCDNPVRHCEVMTNR